MEGQLERGENVQVGIAEKEHFLLSPGDGAISILSFAENTCDLGGREKFAVLETKRGTEVVEIGRFFLPSRRSKTGMTESCRMPSSTSTQSEAGFWRQWSASRNG